MTRRLLTKTAYGFNFKKLAEKLDVSSDYVYQVMMMNIEPNKNFIKRLEQLENDR